MPGRVIVQSYNPENFTIQCAKRQNYEEFYDIEIALRKQLKYPPFCDIIVVNFNSLLEDEIKKSSQWVYDYLKSKLDEKQFKVFKPMPSPIDKIQNRIRYRIIIKGHMTKEANAILNSCLKDIYDKDLKSTRVMVDVNPNNMI